MRLSPITKTRICANWLTILLVIGFLAIMIVSIAWGTGPIEGLFASGQPGTDPYDGYPLCWDERGQYPC